MRKYLIQIGYGFFFVLFISACSKEDDNLVFRDENFSEIEINIKIPKSEQINYFNVDIYKYENYNTYWSYLTVYASRGYNSSSFSSHHNIEYLEAGSYSMNIHIETENFHISRYKKFQMLPSEKKTLTIDVLNNQIKDE